MTDILGSEINHTDILRVQKLRYVCNCRGHSANSAPHASSIHPRAVSLPPFSHATQVAGGLSLSLTAANYRLTRPRCALHDCLAPHSGYPE